jgi:hypothetical protein
VTSKQGIASPDSRHAFYAALEDEFGDVAIPKWNFAKVLIGRDGEVKGLFPPHMQPSDPQLVAAIQRELDAAPVLGDGAPPVDPEEAEAAKRAQAASVPSLDAPLP